MCPHTAICMSSLVHLQNYRLANKLLGTDVSICYNIRMHTLTLTHALHTYLQHYWLGTKLLGKEVSICYNIVKQVYAYACAHALHPHTRSYNIVKQV